MFNNKALNVYIADEANAGGLLERLAEIAAEESRHKEVLEQLLLEIKTKNADRSAEGTPLAPTAVPKYDIRRIDGVEDYPKAEPFRAEAAAAKMQEVPFEMPISPVEAPNLAVLQSAAPVPSFIKSRISTTAPDAAYEKPQPPKPFTFPKTATEHCEKNAVRSGQRDAWEQHAWWTRSLMYSAADCLKDKDSVLEKLAQSPSQIAAPFYKYFGGEAGTAVEELVAEHISIGGGIIDAAVTGGGTDNLSKAWSVNADDIARALAAISPRYDEARLRELLQSHLKMTGEELAQITGGKYAAAVDTFGNVLASARELADCIAGGIC